MEPGQDCGLKHLPPSAQAEPVASHWVKLWALLEASSLDPMGRAEARLGQDTAAGGM